MSEYDILVWGYNLINKKLAGIKKLFVLLIFIIFLINTALASETEDIKAGEMLVKNRVSCSSLSNEQLENIGEYYMELMHPRELHETMDARMGGEGSESLKQVHINIAKMMYCGETSAMPMSMMNIMMNRGGFGGMMNNWFGSGYGMMGGSYPAFGGFMMIFWILVIILIVYLLYKLLNGHGLNLGTTSIEILKKRYASGEITKKQYERMKRQLR